MRYLLLLSIVVLVPSLALAGGPLTGVYNSTDFGGQVLIGHFSESWVDPPYRDGVVNNTINAQSWDSATLGTQWRLTCPSLAVVVLTSDGRDGNGTGDVVYDTDYTGGSLWLSKTGPWGDNTIDYTATIQAFHVTSTHQYIMGTRTGVRSNITFHGQFDAPVDEQCFTYEISNAAIQGNTDLMPKPASFPAFLDVTDCPNNTVTRGAWGPVSQITLTILGTCTIPVEESTWGAIKAIYRE